MRKMVVNLGSKKGDRNDDYYSKITDLKNYLLMIIVGTTEKDIYQAQENTLIYKVHTSSVKSYS